MSSADIKPKKGPGRPPSVKPKKSPVRSGIVKTPVDSKNVIEFQYDMPMFLKKNAALLKSLKTERVRFVFDHRGLTMYAKNFKETNQISIFYDGTKINRYYCEEPITIGLNFNNLCRVLNKINKSYETVSFIITRDSINKSLFVNMQHSMNICSYTEIEIIIDENENEYKTINQPEEYTLQFKLDGNYFKQMINDAQQFDKQWTIEMHGRKSNLVFSYQSENKQVKGHCVPANLNDIEVKNTLGDTEIFSVSTYIDAIIPTSKNLLSNSVLIKASKDQPLCIIVTADNDAITSTSLIKIVDHRV